MKANELMIGDWVQGYLPDTFSRVVGIPNEYRLAVMTPSGGYMELSIDDFQPIPLTPEILEKNGFKPDVPGDAYKYSYQIDSVSIIECYINAVGVGRHRSIISFGDTRLRITLMFVHQLQHCLKLVGIEKDIVL